MSKRQRPLRLKAANKVGWVAEFPTDIWGVIIESMTHKEEVPNFALWMTLIGTSKTMCQLIKPLVIEFCHNVLDFTFMLASATYYENLDPKSSLLYTIKLFIKHVKLFKCDLIEYINACEKNEAYHTAECLSNCLSLFRFIELETRYLKPIDTIAGSFNLVYKHKPLVKPGKDAFGWDLSDVMYFKSSVDKAVVLRLAKEVGVVRNYYGSSNNGESPSLYIQAQRLLIADNDSTRLTKLQKIDDEEGRRAFKSMIINIIGEKGPLLTTKPRADDQLDDLVITIDGRQYYFFSPEAESFIKCCFSSHRVSLGWKDTNLTVKEATVAYKLDKLYDRNIERITKSDRFKIK